MKSRGKTAIVLGATGLVGGTLLKIILEDPRYHKVMLFSRRTVGFQHEKLKEHLVDLLKLEDYKNQFVADEVFCCIGTTNARTPDKNNYKKIDYGIPLSTAKLCKQNDIRSLVVVSSLGASASSSIFYNRVKGEMEEAVLQMHIPKAHIVQPSIIGGDRDEKRPMEYVFKKLMKFFGLLLIGPFKKYKVIHPRDIALAMVWMANSSFSKQIITSDELKTLAQNAN